MLLIFLISVFKHLVYFISCFLFLLSVFFWYSAKPCLLIFFFFNWVTDAECSYRHMLRPGMNYGGLCILLLGSQGRLSPQSMRITMLWSCILKRVNPCRLQVTLTWRTSFFPLICIMAPSPLQVLFFFFCLLTRSLGFRSSSWLLSPSAATFFYR